MQMPEKYNAQEDVSEGKTGARPTTHTPGHSTAAKRAAAVLAKKKQRRAAHRVMLRRPHSKG